MSDYLSAIAARSLQVVRTVQPRLASRFEPVQRTLAPGAERSWQSLVGLNELKTGVPADRLAPDPAGRDPQGNRSLGREDAATGMLPSILLPPFSLDWENGNGASLTGALGLSERKEGLAGQPDALAGQIGATPPWRAHSGAEPQTPALAPSARAEASFEQRGSLARGRPQHGDRLAMTAEPTADPAMHFSSAAIDRVEAPRAAATHVLSGRTPRPEGEEVVSPPRQASNQASDGFGGRPISMLGLPWPELDIPSASEMAESGQSPTEPGLRQNGRRPELTSGAVSGTLPNEGPRRAVAHSLVARPFVASSQPSAPAAQVESAQESAPSIQVTIGRIEVRAAPAAAAPAARRTTPPVMGLDEYLRRRERGERR
ncbi:MAG: hypothetical protein ACR2PL_25970 [Dehalococcoidia bacterium]